VLPSGQSLTLSLLSIITLEVVPLRALCTVVSAFAIFKCILKSCSVKVFRNRLLFCFDHLNCVKLAAYQVYFQSGIQKVGRVGDNSHIVFRQNLLVEKKCETVRCRDETASSFVAKFRGEVFAHFHAVALKRHRSMWN
jgi:hypothetical protein